MSTSLMKPYLLPFKLEKDALEALERAGENVNSSSSSKHIYLSDYKKFETAFGYKNVTLQVAKAAILSSSQIMIEFQKHEDTIAEAIANQKPCREYDWHAAINKQTPIFMEKASLFIGTSWIRKCYELYALLHFPHKITDKLTKDVVQSAIRKFAKHKSFLCLFHTALWNSSLTYVSLFTYDIVFKLSNLMFSRSITTNQLQLANGQDGEVSNNVTVKGGVISSSQRYIFAALTKLSKFTFHTVKWLSKKGVLYTICWISSSAGVCVGALAHPNYGSAVGALVLETICSTAAIMLLDL